MTTPNITTFRERAKQGNLVPVYRELLADQVTPLSIYSRLREAAGGGMRVFIRKCRGRRAYRAVFVYWF